MTARAYRDIRGLPRLESLAQDLRLAARVLRKGPIFTSVAVATLALGIGANGAIFGVADALLSRPLRSFDASRLAVVATSQKAPAAAADYVDWARLNRSFTDLAAYRQRNVNLTGAGAAERLYGTEVSSNFFATLGVGAALGRIFAPADDMNDEPVAVLAHAYWQRRFGGDVGVVGHVVNIDDRPVTIVGVAPADVELPMPTDVWLPLALTPGGRARRETLTLRVVGRLRPGATIEEAQSEFSAIGHQLELSFPATNRDRRVHVMPLSEFVQGSITRRALFLLLGCVGTVLAIACVNIAGLQLARLARRERECNLRTALGASRWRIAQLALVENVLIAALGGAGGIVVALACIGLLLRSMPANIVRLIPGFAQIHVDRRALIFMIAVTLTTGVLSGAAPSLMWSRGRLVSRSSRQRLRSLFVVAQIAVALVMVVVGVLFVRGQRELVGIHKVPQPEDVVVLNVSLPATRYPDDTSRARFYASSLRRLAITPGVRSVATCTTPPLSNNGTTGRRIEIEGQGPTTSAPAPAVVDQRISPDFFQVAGISLRAGRAFDAKDRQGTLPVAIVSNTMARQYWPSGNPIGRRLRVRNPSSSPWLEIVGVAGDVLYDWTNRVPEAVLYQPVAQAPSAESALLVRVSGDAALSVNLLRHELGTVDPLLPAYGVMSLRDAMAESFAGTAQITAIMNMLAGLAFVIAIIGIYGVVAYNVAARTREFGVRLALGARRVDIFRLVMRHAIGLSALGVFFGVAASFAAARVTGALVFSAGSTTTAMTLAGTAVLVAMTTLLAACVPARRAMNADPMNSLRVE